MDININDALTLFVVLLAAVALIVVPLSFSVAKTLKKTEEQNKKQ